MTSTSTVANCPKPICRRSIPWARPSPGPAPATRTRCPPVSSTSSATTARSPATAATGARSRAAPWSAKPSSSGGATATPPSAASNPAPHPRVPEVPRGSETPASPKVPQPSKPPNPRGPETPQTSAVAGAVVFRARRLVRHPLRVVDLTGLVDVPGVGVGPVHQLLDRLQQGAPQRGQLVVDPGRDDRVHGPGHQPVALQPAQGHGQHPAGDPVDAAAQFTETLAALAEL